MHRKRLQEVVNVWQCKYRDLEKKFDTLQEFVTSNVGVTPPPLGETTSANRTPAPATPPQRPPPPTSQNDSLAATHAPLPASQEEEFQPVRNGAKPMQSVRRMETLTTFNRFQVLGKALEEDFETRLVGDSMIRGQLVEFCGRSSNSRRKRFCYPGARLDDVTAVCEDVTRDADPNALYIIHAGTNDVKTTRSEELLEKYRRMIAQYKRKTNGNNIIISGILPRVGAEQSFYNKSFSTNNRLQSLCAQENVQFVNFWNHFYHDTSLYQTDGIHLNSVGAARFGRLLCDQVTLHKSKNAGHVTAGHPP